MDIWPDKGIIEFKDVHMKYRNELPNVLNGLTFSVKSGEKIGIIGRTGAGKSTIFVTLLRLVEIENGIICIDNINISTIPLTILRSRISIIPQDPILFSGNIRFNLDPFNPTTLTLKNFIQKYNKSTKNSIHLYKTLTKIGIKTVDELHNKLNLDDIENKNDKNEINGLKEYLNDCDNKLIEALKVSHCYEFLLENNSNNEIENVLDMKVDENGSNFSVGERQLICLSRAIIRKSSILLLDEATSSVDSQTDKLIQETIRNVFCNKTILTIAHRIDTILDYDRILILDKGGKVLQYDSPTNLLNDEKSKFSQIVQESFGIDRNHIKSYLKNDITDTDINLKICSTSSKDSSVSCV